jgi:hypothetical protein
MKKVCVLFAIIIANNVFISCTDLDENLENDLVKLEVFATGGEDGDDPEEEEEENQANGN